MATTIATGALPPKVAVTVAAILNFIGAFISLSVAATVAGGIIDANVITPTVVFVGRRLVRRGDRARDVHRRLADHQDARDEGRRGVPHGFGSQAVAATVILVSSNAGYPLSTTQVVSGAVTGSGVGRPGAAVNWGAAGRIVIGWILTLAAAAATGGIVYAVIKLFGDDSAVGPIVTGVALAIGCFLLWRANKGDEVEPGDTISERPVFGERAATPAPVAA